MSNNIPASPSDDKPDSDTNHSPTSGRSSKKPEPKSFKPPPLIDLSEQAEPESYQLPTHTAYPILLSGSVHLLTAPPKSGKSFLALELAWAVASDGSRKFLDKFECDDRGPVLYIAGEGADETRGRNQVLLEQRGTKHLVHKLYLWPCAVDFGVDAQCRAVIECAKRMRAKLIIIDTVSRCGAGDETTGTMQEFVTGITKLNQETGATILLLHHPPKNNSKDNPSRGSGVLNGAVSGMWTVSVSPSNGLFQLKEYFSRSAGSSREVLASFRIEHHHLGKNRHNREVGYGYVVPQQHQEAAAKADRVAGGSKLRKRALQTMSKRDEVEAFVRERPEATISEIVEACGCSRGLAFKVRTSVRAEAEAATPSEKG